MEIHNNGWYEYDTGMVVCGRCVLADLEKTRNNELDDAPVTIEMLSDTETPAQCESCFDQSPDYDTLYGQE